MYYGCNYMLNGGSYGASCPYHNMGQGMGMAMGMGVYPGMGRFGWDDGMSLASPYGYGFRGVYGGGSFGGYDSYSPYVSGYESPYYGYAHPGRTWLGNPRRLPRRNSFSGFKRSYYWVRRGVYFVSNIASSWCASTAGKAILGYDTSSATYSVGMFIYYPTVWLWRGAFLKRQLRQCPFSQDEIPGSRRGGFCELRKHGLGSRIYNDQPYSFWQDNGNKLPRTQAEPLQRSLAEITQVIMSQVVVSKRAIKGLLFTCWMWEFFGHSVAAIPEQIEWGLSVVHCFHHEELVLLNYRLFQLL